MLSIGQTNGVRVRNAGRFNTGIKITVPEIFFGSSDLLNRITASTAGYSPPWTPALTNKTGPGLIPATEITGRGSSFAKAAPGNLIKCRCVVPAFNSPRIGIMKTRSNLETGRQEKLIRKTGIEEIRKGIYKTGNNNFLRSCFPY